MKNYWLNNKDKDKEQYVDYEFKDYKNLKTINVKPIKNNNIKQTNNNSNNNEINDNNSNNNEPNGNNNNTNELRNNLIEQLTDFINVTQNFDNTIYHNKIENALLYVRNFDEFKREMDEIPNIVFETNYFNRMNNIIYKTMPTSFLKIWAFDFFMTCLRHIKTKVAL